MALFLALCFSVSCRSPCRQWELLRIQSDCPQATFFRAQLESCSRLNGLEAELVYSAGCLDFYLNSLTLLLPWSNEDPQYADVTVCIEGEDALHFLASRLEGGQRLLLPREAEQQIVAALLADRTVDIAVGHYATTLIPDNFQKVYDEMTHSLGLCELSPLSQ